MAARFAFVSSSFLSALLGMFTLQPPSRQAMAVLVSPGLRAFTRRGREETGPGLDLVTPLSRLAESCVVSAWTVASGLAMFAFAHAPRFRLGECLAFAVVISFFIRSVSGVPTISDVPPILKVVGVVGVFRISFHVAVLVSKART